jgi:hypothetical protein
MPRVGFEPTIPVFEEANTLHAPDPAATVTGSNNFEINWFFAVKFLIFSGKIER